MWSRTHIVDGEREVCHSPEREKLLVARIRMEEALSLLDAYSCSAAAASLDLAMHQLDRELSTH